MIDVGNVEIRFDYDSPQTKDVLRCLKVLYSTREGSQPLDRDFGLNWGFIDKPLPVAKSEYEFEVIKKTRKYEKRVKVKEVTYVYEGESGKIKPVIALTKGESE